MISLKSTLIFLILGVAFCSQSFSQTPSAGKPDAASLPSQTAIRLNSIIIDDPSVAFDEVDQTGIEHRSITAEAYCDFLNSAAVTDTENLYDEKMGSDPEAAYIIRCGLPGDYSYEVIAGRENFALTYLTPKSAGYFLEWLENNPLRAENDVEQASEDNDFFLGSNWLGYCISAPFIAPTDALTETSSNEKNIFDYTPGATVGQRVLEYFFFLLGLGFGALAAESAGFFLLAATACIPSCITTIIMVLVGFACIFAGAYLGEKLGKWLGS